MQIARHQNNLHEQYHMQILSKPSIRYSDMLIGRKLDINKDVV